MVTLPNLPFKVGSGSPFAVILFKVGAMWNGAPITIKATVTDSAPAEEPLPNGGTRYDPPAIVSWNVTLSQLAAPTTMTCPDVGTGQNSVAQEFAGGNRYVYTMGPAAPPAYGGLLMTEEFSNFQTSFVIPDDLDPNWLAGRRKGQTQTINPVQENASKLLREDIQDLDSFLAYIPDAYPNAGTQAIENDNTLADEQSASSMTDYLSDAALNAGGFVYTTQTWTCCGSSFPFKITKRFYQNTMYVSINALG